MQEAPGSEGPRHGATEAPFVPGSASESHRTQRKLISSDFPKRVFSDLSKFLDKEASQAAACRAGRRCCSLLDLAVEVLPQLSFLLPVSSGR